MHSIELKIIQLLGQDISKEWSTTQLVQKIFSSEFEEVNINIHSSDKVKVLEAKRKKAQLHRKILYHVNKLVEENFIFVTKVKGKGEKYFALNKDKKVENKRDEKVRSVFENLAHTAIDSSILSGLEKFEENKIINVFSENNWTNKLNAILLNPIKNSAKLYQRISDIYQNYNDVLGIYDFQETIEHQTIEEILRFLKKIDVDSIDYNKRICLNIDTTTMTNASKMQSFVESFSAIAPKNISCIFMITNESLKINNKLFKEIVKLFSEHKIRLNIQNKNLNEVPIIIGRAGTYNIPLTQWKQYIKNVANQVIGISLADTSIAIDLRKVFLDPQPFKLLKELISKSAKALIIGSSAQRRRSDMIFTKINELNKPNQHKFFEYTTSMIRLWNYDLEKEYFDQLVVHLQGSAIELEQFSKAQRTIFRACGLPITVNISLSSALRKFTNKFSKRKYNKITIHSKKDLLSEEIKHYIEQRQQLLEIMSSDRIRFFRAEETNNKKIVDELFVLLEIYRIPLFAYDFKKRQGETTLDSFF